MRIQHRPRLLCLDGGAVYGLSELLILRHLMNDISVAANLDSPALPYKYFDLIGGVGMGALIAVMLGRLGMVIIQATSMLNVGLLKIRSSTTSQLVRLSSGKRI